MGSSSLTFFFAAIRNNCLGPVGVSHPDRKLPSIEAFLFTFMTTESHVIDMFLA